MSVAVSINYFGEWSFDVTSSNRKHLCGGYQYNSKSNAIKGATAAAKELNKWLDARKKKSPPKPKNATTAHQKPAGRRLA